MEARTSGQYPSRIMGHPQIMPYCRNALRIAIAKRHKALLPRKRWVGLLRWRGQPWSPAGLRGRRCQKKSSQRHILEDYGCLRRGRRPARREAYAYCLAKAMRAPVFQEMPVFPHMAFRLAGARNLVVIWQRPHAEGQVSAPWHEAFMLECHCRMRGAPNAPQAADRCSLLAEKMLWHVHRGALRLARDGLERHHR